MGFLSPPKIDVPAPPPAPPPPPAFGITKQPPRKTSQVPTFLAGLGGGTPTGGTPTFQQGKTLLGS